MNEQQRCSSDRPKQGGGEALLRQLVGSDFAVRLLEPVLVPTDGQREQPPASVRDEPVRVDVRCDKCRRRRSDRVPPALAVVAQTDDGRWWGFSLSRRSSRAAASDFDRVTAAVAEKLGEIYSVLLNMDPEHAEEVLEHLTNEYGPAAYDTKKRAAELPMDGTSGRPAARIPDLHCRSCGAAPRIKRRDLYDRALVAYARGRSVIYV